MEIKDIFENAIKNAYEVISIITEIKQMKI